MTLVSSPLSLLGVTDAGRDPSGRPTPPHRRNRSQSNPRDRGSGSGCRRSARGSLFGGRGGGGPVKGKQRLNYR